MHPARPHGELGTRQAWPWLAWLCGLIVGCVGGAPLPQAAAPVSSMPSQRLPSLDALVAPEAFAEARLDLRRVLADPTFVALERRLIEILRVDDNAQDVAYWQGLAHRVEQVAWAAEGPPGSRFDDLVVLARGRFGTEDLERLSEGARATDYEGRPLRVQGTWAAGLIGDHTLVVGPLRHVEATCDRFDGRRPAGPGAHATLAEARGRAGFGHHPLTYAVHWRSSPDSTDNEAERAVIAHDGHCAVDPALRCEFGITTNDADALEPLRAQLQQVLDLFAAPTPAFPLPEPLAAMARAVTFRTEGTRLVAALVQTPEELHAALDAALDVLASRLEVRRANGAPGGP
ncbi:MAG: hypothetical protein H6726_19880 [Sandaracinaceae bacterium]|nr:hypothetical protein [Sandaracinaceae bacterium]